MTGKNIHQRINSVMAECDYLQKKEAQAGKGLRYDDLVAMLRPLIIKHGITVSMDQQEISAIGDVGAKKSQKIYQGKYKLTLTNMDTPSDTVSHTVYSHGMDGGDKGPGKAHTYAAKAMLKVGFLVETGEDEESRAEKMESETITQVMHAELARYCLEVVDGTYQWSKLGTKLAQKYELSTLADLPKSKYREVLSVCKSRSSTT